MVYGFARQSGGQVRIYSEVGQGTMVCLYLPRHHGDADGPERVAEPAAAPPGVRGRYVIHCHNTTHEDHAMMQTWNVIQP